MAPYLAEVRPRWSDMDAFGHVNHANLVTLLEDARIELLFTAAKRAGITGMARGSVVARVVVDYHTPLVFDGSAVRVEMAVREARAASFLIDYTVRAGLSEVEPIVATAETLIVPYDLVAARPRRLTSTEQAFLRSWDGQVRHG
ncbi:acyl-CoA thioester hydrolase [Tamaricihabitans halophyticus]|uniref:Acyl-CoA thioester hydrolase n=1 Tax=Tamaricihabitans halophyticus TaxID=1262583 RepID=A0A4R2QNA0_9PSEU|nr:acyl-CoA thioesterase [Tamaricihabitans halophyticus]TCP48541.1 acyl-CoA thioester hydrolase [Tamaricihabitans halophyticus]